MVKKLSLSILVLFLSSCGFYPIEPGYIDPEFVSFVEQYKKDKQKYLGISTIERLSITFKTLEKADGRCVIAKVGNKITNHTMTISRNIYINPETWFSSNYSSKLTLIYHELGHCDLRLSHSDSNTIMNPYGIDFFTFESNPDYYLNLLFNHGK